MVGDPATGHVFALGVCGFFQCLDGETGKTIWSHAMSEDAAGLVQMVSVFNLEQAPVQGAASVSRPRIS